MITLDTINSAYHSIEIANAAGQALAIDGSGYLTANINGTVTVDASDLDIRDLSSSTDSVAAVQSGVWDIGTVTTLTGITNDVNIADGGNSITVDAVDLDIRDLAFASDSVTAHQGGSWSFTLDNISSWKNTAASVSTTVGELVATPLTGRSKLIIQNLGSNDIYIGPDNLVTTSNGLKVPKGSSIEMNFDTSADIYAITASSTSDIIVSEYAA